MTRLSIPHADYSPEMHDLLCDHCPRCGSDMGDDAHDDLDVWVCADCCTACRLASSDVSVGSASDGGGDRSSRPEQVTATTPANQETP